VCCRHLRMGHVARHSKIYANLASRYLDDHVAQERLFLIHCLWRIRLRNDHDQRWIYHRSISCYWEWARTVILVHCFLITRACERMLSPSRTVLNPLLCGLYTLTMNSAKRVAVISTGASKADAVRAVVSPAGCMWVHLHPIHTPVHPPFDLTLCNLIYFS
jgi:hypothetical protein